MIEEKIIYIEPTRSNMKTYTARWKDGKLYDAPYSWWAEKTGSNTARMCARARAVRQGHRDYTMEQILGIDKIPLLNGMTEKAKQLSVVEECKMLADPMSVFLRSKLI